MTSLAYSDWIVPTGSKRTPTLGKPIITPPVTDTKGPANNHPETIHALLDKMNIEEQQQEAHVMQTFQPIEPPQNMVKTDKVVGGPLSPVQPMYGGRAAAAAALANYQSVYERPTDMDGYYQQQRSRGQGTKERDPFDRYMEKLNYLIHLLEEQQKEQTAGATEEFLLYCLFGVFVIFVVDAFARYGKNVGMGSVKPRYRR